MYKGTGKGKLSSILFYRAEDLFVLFHSFKPQMGKLFRVSIYPSEFGKQRMAEEKMKGPAEFIQSEQKCDESNKEEGENGGRLVFI